jgi:polar amino acid transport system substrate-binding protein
MSILKSLLFILVCCLLSGCNEDSEEKSTENTTQVKQVKNTIKSYNIPSTTDYTQEDLIVGISPDNMPFEFMKNGEIKGFDVDLINAIAQKLQMNVIVKNMQFYLIIPSLESGDIDIAISSISATPERAAVIDFSTPYYYDDFALLSIDNLDPNDPIKDGMRIGVQTGTLMHQWIMKQDLQVDVVTMDSNLILVEELKNKNLDGILMDAITANGIAKASLNEIMKVAHLKGINATARSIGVRKGDDILEKINSAINELQVSGELDKMKKDWGL